MREVVAAHMKQFEYFVERRRIRGLGRANGEDAFKITRQEFGVQQRFACSHPIAMALHCIDLAVVSDISEGMSQRPRRERVR